MRKIIWIMLTMMYLLNVVGCTVNTDNRKGEYDIYQTKALRTSEK